MTSRDIQIHIGRLLVHSDALPAGATTAQDFAALVQQAIGERLAGAEQPRQSGSGTTRAVANGILDLPQVAGRLADGKGRFER